MHFIPQCIKQVWCLILCGLYASWSEHSNEVRKMNSFLSREHPTEAYYYYYNESPPTLDPTKAREAITSHRMERHRMERY